VIVPVIFEPPCIYDWKGVYELVVRISSTFGIKIQNKPTKTASVFSEEQYHKLTAKNSCVFRKSSSYSHKQIRTKFTNNSMYYINQ
jgi:hypothetical protein